MFPTGFPTAHDFHTTRLDQDLGAQRDLVTKTKHERDEHRLGFTGEDSGCVHQALLVDEFGG